MDKCANCDFAEPSYNSCRNRHCPKCQALAQARWLAERRRRILPTHYFHVVFTLPSELRQLARWNRKKLYGLLFRAASQTLLALGRDPKMLGAVLGVTAVLHTWTRDLRFHPHLHCIVTGGGLALDQDRWIASRKNYLFPVKVLAKLFRAKLLDGLKHARRKGELALPPRLLSASAFKALITKLFNKNWVVYAKKPFAGADQVFAYLGRYTHRVAISNHRIINYDGLNVTIRTRGDDSVTMTAETFIARFVEHVLPRGFTKIRHFGLMAPSNVNTRLVAARVALLKQQAHQSTPIPLEVLPASDWRTVLELLCGIDLTLCPRCGTKGIQRFALEHASQRPVMPRGPP